MWLLFNCDVIFVGTSPAEEEEEATEENGEAAAVAQQSQSNLSGKDILAQLKIGTRVVKGPDWKWGDQVINNNITNYISQKYIMREKCKRGGTWHNHTCTWFDIHFFFLPMLAVSLNLTS